MLKHKLFIAAIMFGFALSGISALVAYFYEPLRNVFFIIALVLFVMHLAASQIAYAFFAMHKNAAQTRAAMQPCPHCKKPIYKDDSVCPYCKREL